MFPFSPLPYPGNKSKSHFYQKKQRKAHTIAKSFSAALQLQTTISHKNRSARISKAHLARLAPLAIPKARAHRKAKFCKVLTQPTNAYCRLQALPL